MVFYPSTMENTRSARQSGFTAGLSLMMMMMVAIMTMTMITEASGASSSQVNEKTITPGIPVVHEDYAYGDPRRCLEIAQRNGHKMQTFEVLPGYGWDNLRNLNEGQVVAFNYSQCRSTEDGRFLLPDSISAVPVKSSRVHTFAELIDHWKTWTSTTSKSINVDAGFTGFSVGISGKFSADFQDIKSKQIGDKSVTTRTQLRYIRYAVHLQPDTPLHPVFKNRLLAIAAAEELGEKEQARYLSQLLVRDFGTHIVTKAEAGAALEQVDQLRQEWVKSQEEHKSDILASASASFFGKFSIKSSFEYKTDNKFMENYYRQLTSSQVITKGGALFRPSNFTSDHWAAAVDSDLVAMDRAGDPLYYVITAATIPEVPVSTLNELYERVKEAVDVYYSYNRIPGCLDSTSPNFYPAANTEDDSCQPAPRNLTFGGVFQTCSLSSGSNNGNLCEGLTQVNPLSGGFSCPANYEAVKLHSGSTSSSRTQHVCKRHLLFWRRCHDDYYRSTATYNIYWCVATGHLAQESGYMFGGLFTGKVVNPVTRAFSCPPTFFPLSVGYAADLHICIGDDFEAGEIYSLPFAGFISCNAGNPLAVADNTGSVQSKGGRKVRSAQTVPHMKLRQFFKDQADEWSARCPNGYSRHLATVDQGCQINYCVQTGRMASVVLPPIKRPPFISAPPMSAPTKDNVIFDPETHTWKRGEAALKALEISEKEDTANHDHDSGSLTPGTAAGISVGATLACVVLATLAVLAVRAKRRKSKGSYRQLQNPLLDSHADYGAVSGENTSLSVAPNNNTA